MRGRLGFLSATLLIVAGPAQAHIVAARLGDFYVGALHPLTDLQDVVVWLALGVLAGSLGADKGRWLVPLFPVGLVAGLALARLTGLAAPGPVVNALCMVIIGVVLALRVRLPILPLATVAIILGVLRGMANGAELESGMNALLFGAGLAAVGYVAITLVIAATVSLLSGAGGQDGGWKTIAVRALGSWIAAIGVMTAGVALVA